MKTVISVKVDTEVRDNARTAAKKLGLPLSSIINHQLKRFAEEQRFEFRPPLVPNAKTRKLLAKIETDISAGRNMSPGFTNAKDIDRYLDALK